MKTHIIVVAAIVMLLSVFAAMVFAQPPLDVQSQRLMRQMRAADIVKKIHESTDSTDIVEMSPGTVIMFRNYRIELGDFVGNRAANVLLGSQEKPYQLGDGGACVKAPEADVSVWWLARTPRTLMLVVTRNPALQCHGR